VRAVNDQMKSKDVLTLDRFTSRLCKKLSGFCPKKLPPAGFKHKDEIWEPIIDVEGYKMRKMQHTTNKLAKEHGTQSVQFMDPGGVGMFRRPDDDEF